MEILAAGFKLLHEDGRKDRQRDTKNLTEAFRRVFVANTLEIGDCICFQMNGLRPSLWLEDLGIAVE
jgi:hypothetical protein